MKIFEKIYEIFVSVGCVIFIFGFFYSMVVLFYILTPTSIVHYSLYPLRKIGVKVPVQFKFITWWVLRKPYFWFFSLMGV